MENFRIAVLLFSATFFATNAQAQEQIKVRHIDGKVHQGAAYDNLYIQWISKRNTIINAQGGNVGIGLGRPLATLDVARGNAPWGTASFRGSAFASHFNFSGPEHTYIRGGKVGSLVYINDQSGGATIVGKANDVDSKIDLMVYGRLQSNSTSGGLWLSNAKDGLVGNAGSNIGFWTNRGWTFLVNKTSGMVGINTASPTRWLDVNGAARVRGNLYVGNKMISKEIECVPSGGADFVFEDTYALRDLAKVEEFIQANHHLPEIAPAATMVKEGVNVTEFTIQLLQKIEELTLYTIAQEKKINDLATLAESHQAIIALQKAELQKVDDMQARLAQLEQLLTRQK